MVRLGDILYRTPSIDSGCGMVNVGPKRCEVVYIHPERRYYTVRFDFERGSFRECFWFPRYEGSRGEAEPGGVSGWPKGSPKFAFERPQETSPRLPKAKTIGGHLLR